jgi:hypothetical protein
VKISKVRYTKVQFVLFLFLLTLGTLSSAQAGTVEEVEDNAARLESSANWGVHLSTGKIAVDPSLVLYSDAASKTIVTLPKHISEAAATLGATVRADGGFEFADGTVVFPIVGELVIRVGNEPEGLLEESGLPVVDIGGVRLMSPVSNADAVTQAKAALKAGTRDWIGEQRVRSWRICSGCIRCPQGCIGLSFYQGNSYRPCVFSWPWKRCTERFDFRCIRTDFNCRNCTGAIVGESASVDLNCGGC